MSFEDRIKKHISDRDARLSLWINQLQSVFRNIPSALKEIVLNAPVVELVDLLNSHKTNSQTILHIFIQHSLQFGFLLKNATEENFTEAIYRAKECDQERKKSKLKNWTFYDDDEYEPGKYLPPLFGIPMSLKESINQKDMASTCGCAAQLSNIQSQDGYIAAKLRKAGAIFFIRSNVPQSLMMVESFNFIYGRAQNPWDRARTPGGSSGGEAGLIASRCAPLGIGTDIGGSIRTPSEFCGVYGLKPSPNRVPSLGQKCLGAEYGADRIIPFVFGPMGKHPKDIALTYRILTNPQFENKEVRGDPYCFSQRFNLAKYHSKGKLRIGYFKTHHYMPVDQAGQRAVTLAIEAAQKLGHQIILMDMPLFQEITGHMFKMVNAFGRDIYLNLLQGEGTIPEYRQLLLVHKIPNIAKRVLGWLCSWISPRLALLIKSGTEMHRLDLQRQLDWQKNIQLKFLAILDEKSIDYVICPGYGIRAFKHLHSDMGLVYGAYQFLWNILRLPAAAMPVTVATEQEMVFRGVYNDVFQNRARQSQEGCKGMPAGIQIVGRPYDEEGVLRLMREVDEETRFTQKHKYPI